MGIRYSAEVVCDTCGESLPVIDKDIKDPNRYLIISKAKSSGWHFIYASGGLVYCPKCWADRHRMEAGKNGPV